MGTKLEQWRVDNSASYTEIENALGLSRVQVWRLLNNKSHAKVRKLVEDVYKMTGGAVDANALFGVKENATDQR